MRALTIPYPDNLQLAFGQSPEDLENELRFWLAVKLFELGRLSLGKAAEIAGLAKVHFMMELGRHGIPVLSLDPDQIEDEFGDSLGISSPTAAP